MPTPFHNGRPDHSRLTFKPKAPEVGYFKESIMPLIINAIAARVALIAIINAICLVLAGIGKISSDTTALWTEQAGNIFDYLVLIFGALALIMPGILNVVRVDKGIGPNVANRLGLFLAMFFVLPLLMLSGLTACSSLPKLKGPDGKPIVTGEICVPTSNGMFCYKPNEPTIVEPVETPPPGSVGTMSGPNMPALPVSTLPVKQTLEK